MDSADSKKRTREPSPTPVCAWAGGWMAAGGGVPWWVGLVGRQTTLQGTTLFGDQRCLRCSTNRHVHTHTQTRTYQILYLD